MNNTPDFAFIQAYERSVAEKVNRHFIPTKHGSPWETSAYHLPIYPAQHHKTVTVRFQGKFVEAKITSLNDQKYRRGKRATISRFSSASRVRLFDLFHRLEIPNKPIFVTLTYGEGFPYVARAKLHLRAFMERIRRKYKRKKVSGIWRLEFQERGAPHFHIIFFNLPFIPKRVLQAMWGEIIGQDRPFTRIEAIHSHKGLMAYVSKYIAKLPDGENSGFNSVTYLHAYIEMFDDLTGRHWGVFERASLPLAEEIRIECPFDLSVFMRFRACAEREYPPIENYQTPGFRLYVKNAKTWEALYRRLTFVTF